MKLLLGPLRLIVYWTTYKYKNIYVSDDFQNVTVNNLPTEKRPQLFIRPLV